MATDQRGAGWVVLDYDGRALPGKWPTEQEAVDDGLCGRYLLSGFEVVPKQRVGPEPVREAVDPARAAGGVER